MPRYLHQYDSESHHFIFVYLLFLLFLNSFSRKLISVPKFTILEVLASGWVKKHVFLFFFFPFSILTKICVEHNKRKLIIFFKKQTASNKITNSNLKFYRKILTKLSQISTCYGQIRDQPAIADCLCIPYWTRSR